MKTKTVNSGGPAQIDEPVYNVMKYSPERKGHLPDDLRGLIARQSFFKGLTSQQIGLLADAAMEEEFDAGETVFGEGDTANRFYLILEGKVLLETETREHGRIPVQTLGAGSDLGWSWLFPPYYAHFSARAIEPVKVIFFYATRLREHCENDPNFGYQLMKRVAAAMLECLNSTRQELLKRTSAG